MSRINIRLKAGLLILCFFLFSSVIAASSKTEVEDTYRSWCSAIGAAKGNADKVVQYYAPEATLHPTLMPRMLVTHSEMKEYFTKLTNLQNIECTTDKLNIRMHHDIAIVSGFYTFSYVDNGSPQNISARFSFVYKKFDKKWLIIDHHSSKMP